MVNALLVVFLVGILVGIALVVLVFPRLEHSHDVTEKGLRGGFTVTENDEGFRDVEGVPGLENQRPVIGILTQPHEDGKEYIAASYVKYAEAAGARVVAIRYWWPEQQIKSVFKGLNGVLLPGGGADINPKTSKIFKAAQILYDEAEKSNKAGKRFPIWGTCLGWELLSVLASKGNFSIIEDSGPFSHAGVAAPLLQVDTQSRLFSGLNLKLQLNIRAGRRLVYYYHQMGVTPNMFEAHLDSKCWKVTALGRDSKQKMFVAGVESTCRPYYGVQFHPEKSLFEWYTNTDIPHSMAAGDLSRHFISLLSRELRQSRAGNMKEADIFKNHIYQYPAVTNGDNYFYQEYDFPKGTNQATQEDRVAMY